MGSKYYVTGETSLLTVQCIIIQQSDIHTSLTHLILFPSFSGPATITSAPSDNRDVLTGTAIMFTCEVSGIPIPNITWYHNGQPLVNSGKETIAGNVLTIQFTLVEHLGMYQCFADNKISNVYKSWTMQVREQGVYICVHRLCCMCVS